jgi:hypothetical protein
MGSMWAEVRARYIPHRDRGHLRKRYQVLERRIKATVGRIKKQEKLVTTKAKTPSNFQFPPQQYALNARVTSQYPAHHAGRNTVKTVPKSKQSSANATKAGIGKSVATTAKIRSQSTQAQTIKAIPQKQQSVATDGSVSKSEPVVYHPTVPPYPAAPPPYYPPPPYMYHPPPPGSYIPYMPPPYGYYPPYYHAGHGYYEEGSRAGYEQLITDPSRGWSQMPHMKSMLESENEVASTIITQLAKSPPPKPSHQAETDVPDDTIGRDPTSETLTNVKSPTQRILNFDDIHPQSENASPTPNTTNLSNSFFGLPATMPDSSADMHGPTFAPEDSFGVDNTRHGSYQHDSPQLLYAQYENSQDSRNSHSLNGYDLIGSLQNTDSLIRDVASDTPSNMFNETPDHSRLVDIGTHLLDTDLEAVSALNLLRSPTKGVLTRTRESERLSVKKKSLFATVVENVKQKSNTGKKK